MQSMVEGPGTAAPLSALDPSFRPTLIVAASSPRRRASPGCGCSAPPRPATAMAMPMAPWSAAYLLAAFTMWGLMMVAMMLPSAARR